MKRLTLIALSACGLGMQACAGSPLTSTAAPRVDMPETARRPCSIYLLPDNPTQADLEAGYQARGADLVSCNAARALAVKTHDDEHALEDRAAAPPRPWWKVWR